MTWHQRGVTTADPAQVILVSEPYRRLAYSWHTMTPEFATAFGFSDEFRDKVAAERRSRVTFDIEPAGQIVKLTVAHDNFEPGSIVLDNVSQSWPAILANLKTLLETGDILPAEFR